MIDSFLTDLGWLERPPLDFAERCRSLYSEPSNVESQAPAGVRVKALSTFGMGNRQLFLLAQSLRRLEASAHDMGPLEPVRLGLVSNGTTSLLAPALSATAPRHGLLLETIETPFGQGVPDLLDPDSGLRRAEPNYVLLALDHRGLGLPQGLMEDEDGRSQSIARALELVTRLCQVAADSGATPMIQTVPRQAASLFGHFDRRLATTPASLVERLNAELRLLANELQALLLDVADLAENVGLSRWQDDAIWYTAKLPFAQNCLPLYADHVARLIAAARGRSRRCLVLDLDNTLWGGVVGDDGIDNLILGPGSGQGEAHRAIQDLALKLRQRGIVLAVSSKNDDVTARAVFREHPEMLLKEEHIAVFQANWEDKASNIAAIADALSLGRDALVFVDDNPAERAQVRQTLPEVAVPELPGDVALYPLAIMAGGYFEATAFTDADRSRPEYYKANAARAALQDSVSDVEAYLASLSMVAKLSPFDASNRPRVVQLINKTNQFNLTTRRRSQTEVAALEADPGFITLQVRLVDAFGDNGLVSVLVCREQGNSWEIDTWLMSCRVLGRQVERAVLNALVQKAGREGVRTLIGIYRPTDRNSLVKDHYRDLGFLHLCDEEDGASRWTLDLSSFQPFEAPITIEGTFNS